MRLQNALPVGTLLLVLVGSDQKPVTAPAPFQAAPQSKSEPAWVSNEEIPDGLAAVGSAQPNVMGDKAMMRTTAVANARTALAGKLKVRVQNMFSQLNQQVTVASAQTGAKPIRSEAMNRVQENVTRQVVDQELAGTNTRYTWTDPEDGTFYVFVVLTKESMDQAMASAAKAQIKKEIAQGEVALNTALDKLDAAIAASAKPAN